MSSGENGGNTLLKKCQIENLKNHVYKSSGTTVLDPYMQVYWRKLVEFVPLWVAPNMITLLGLIINITTSLLLVYYCPDGRSKAPSEVYIACGIGLFIYQSLDAIDGKHARRTGTNNPLGELFDHGCDAFSTVFVILAYGIATDLGPTFWFFYLCCMCNCFFYAAHWRTLVSGTLHFGRYDVTEVQMFLIGIQLWTGIFGPGLWNVTLFDGFQVKHLLIVLSTVGTFGSFVLSGNLQTILSGGCGKNGATVADTSVLSPVIPIFLVSLMFYQILRESSEQLYTENAVLFLLTLGFTFTKITVSLVVAHMTRSPPTLIDSVMLGPLALIFAQYTRVLPEYWVLYLALGFTCYESIGYSVQICREICSSLEIPCLTMPKNVKLVDPPATVSKKSSSSSNILSDKSRIRKSSLRAVSSTSDITRPLSMVTRASARASVIRRPHSTSGSASERD